MKRSYLFVLFFVLLGWGVCSCGSAGESGEEGTEVPVTAPHVSIQHPEFVESCLPGRKVELWAQLQPPTRADFRWSVNGEEVSTDSVYEFSSTAEGRFLIRLEAGNEAGESSDSLSIRVVDGFGFADIEHWTGEGDCCSALVVQWTTGDDLLHPADEEVFALAWGYRWKEEEHPTGMDMIERIVGNDPRLYVMAASQWGGVTIRGFGYDGNRDGKLEIRNETLHLTEADFGEARIYWLSEGEDCDRLVSVEPADYWQGGWYVAYASYWLGEGEAMLSPEAYDYSQVLASGRVLNHLSWDAWTFSPINMETEENIYPIPRLLQAAPKE